jgi:RNA polymerase sigma-70 factor (ECF subfamily)
VQEAATRLPDDYRVALHLRECDELTYQEIAQVLGLSRAVVKNRLFRARVAFRQLWNGQDEADAP